MEAFFETKEQRVKLLGQIWYAWPSTAAFDIQLPSGGHTRAAVMQFADFRDSEDLALRGWLGIVRRGRISVNAVVLSWYSQERVMKCVPPGEPDISVSEFPSPQIDASRAGKSPGFFAVQRVAATDCGYEGPSAVLSAFAVAVCAAVR